MRLGYALALALVIVIAAPRLLVAEPPPSASRSPSTSAGADPLDVSADRLELDVEAKTAVLTGNVRLTKGPVTVSCPRVDARYDDGPQIVWAKGTGGVVADIRGVRAEAPEVELDLGKQLVELRGGVRLSRGGGWIKAEKATIDMATAKVTMTEVKGSLPVGKPSP
jgi:lipopolysaccharide transport protein LptA